MGLVYKYFIHKSCSIKSETAIETQEDILHSLIREKIRGYEYKSHGHIVEKRMNSIN